MNGPGRHCAEWFKPDSYCMVSHIKVKLIEYDSGCQGMCGGWVGSKVGERVYILLDTWWIKSEDLIGDTVSAIHNTVL